MTISNDMRPYFQAAALLSILLLAGDMLLSAKFGYTISAELMIIIAAVSLASGILPVIAWFFRRAGHSVIAYVLLAAWIPAFGFNVFSNMGVATANRMGEVQQASVIKTGYAEKQKTVEEAEARLTMFTGQLASLIEQNAWAVNVTAEALRQQSADLATAVEEEGSQKNGGCKRKCLDLMAQKKNTDSQIAVAEQRFNLDTQIDATKRVLATARAELGDADAGISLTANQSTLYAKLVNWDLGGDPDGRSVTTANELTGIMTAIVLAILAAAITLAGAFPGLMQVTPSSAVAMTETHAKTNAAIHAVMNPTPKVTHKTLLDLARERGMTFSGAAA